VFHKLQKDEIKQIVDLLLRRIRGSLAERDLQLELTTEAEDFLVEKGWDPAMGARPLRRAIQRYIEDPLADEVLKKPMTPGSTVLVERDEDAKQKAEAGEVVEEELKITILAPVDKPPQETPVPVGGADEGEEPPPEGDEPAPEQPSEN
jgi:ATP-dependent Clp protease ATP-binding subunit ClpC